MKHFEQLFPLRYCLTCGRIVATLEGEMHTNVVQTEINAELVECYGPFALSTPPVNFEEDWDLELVEPSQEELAEMNLQAEILLQELES